jgi:hypothetical protein
MSEQIVKVVGENPQKPLRIWALCECLYSLLQALFTNPRVFPRLRIGMRRNMKKDSEKHISGMRVFQSVNFDRFWSCSAPMWRLSKRADWTGSTRTPLIAFTVCFAGGSWNWLMPRQRLLPGVWKWMKATSDQGGFVAFAGAGQRGKSRLSVFSKEAEESSVPPCPIVRKAELLKMIKGHVSPVNESIIFTDGWRGYDGLVLEGYKHYRGSSQRQ